MKRRPVAGGLGRSVATEINDLVLNLQEPSAKEWIAAVIDATSHAEATRIFVTMWALWHARRKIIHEGLYQPPLSTFHFVERFLQDLELVEKSPSAGEALVAWTVAPRWIPPPAGLSKVNVDAALSKNSAHDAVAAVARGETGAFLGASSVVFHGMSDLETVEAMACREALALAQELHLQRITMASDCISVINAKAMTVSRGRLNHVSAEGVEEDPGVLMGTLRINDYPCFSLV